MFQYSADDINNKLLFNVTQIQKRYRRFAKFYHPDKKHANPAVFIKVKISEQILLFIADGKSYEFPSNWYLLLEDEDTLNAMRSWKKEHKAIGYQHSEESVVDIDDDDNAPDLDDTDDNDNDSDSASQIRGAWGSMFSGIFRGK